MCNWRRSIKMFYQLSEVMDFAQAAGPDMKVIFLTLTVRNASGQDLGATLDTMFDGWNSMISHRRFRKAIFGWFRALEVTYNAETDTYHPHFHVLLMVDKLYFTNPKLYLHTTDWVHIFRVSCGLDYDPICDIRAVGARKAKSRRRVQHVAEITKYTVKDKDYIHEDQEVTVRVVGVLGPVLRGRRLFAFGGTLKKIAAHLKAENAGEGDWININADARMRDDVADMLAIYKWDFGLRDYFRVYRPRKEV